MTAGGDLAAETAGSQLWATEARLQVRDLEVRLAGGDDVVSEIAFEIAPGEILGLVGESGSGKSTAALALLAYARRGLVISRGEVLLDGVDVLKISRHAASELRGSKIAYVPQDPSAALNPALRVGTQLRDTLPGRADIDERLAQVLRETRLDDVDGLMRRYPHQLSGGQQQRLVLAMAFAPRPRLIVFDEPTTGLDVSTQRHVLETVQTLCTAYGVAGVFVSHDLAVVGGIAARVGVMYAGRIVELGDTRDVFGAPAHPYTRRLLAAVPSPVRAHVLQGIDGHPPRPGQRPPGCSFASRCEFAAEQCRHTPPPRTEVGTRLVRCLRAAEIGADRAASQVVADRRSPPAADGKLVVTQLTAYYGQTRVLDGVDLNVRRETCMAIVGESGSGKTTLARCLVGLHPGWSGQVLLDGHELAPGRKRSIETLRRIQYVFQNPFTSLNPRKTIAQIVIQPLEHFRAMPFAACHACAVKALGDVSLPPDIMTLFPAELSGGERQRVAIARALVVEPEVLVCDEITSSLDVSVQAVVVELLRRLQREQRLTLIFITHNLALVRTIAQDVAVLNEGHVIEAGPADEVLSNPQTDYTVSLLKAVPVLAHGMSRDPGTAV